MAFVRNPIVYVPDLTNGRPVVDGKVYIFAAGTIPPVNAAAINPATLLTITFVNEAGNTVEQSQPLYTSKGGCLYGNYPQAAAQYIASNNSYVFAAYNKNGKLQYSANTFGSDAVESADLAAANSTQGISGFQARQLQLIDGIKNLIAISGVLMSVKGFYAGSSIGGGDFYYDPTISKLHHNGLTIIAPESLGGWDGTQTNIASLLNWSGDGVGCFLRTVRDSLNAWECGAVDYLESETAVPCQLQINKALRSGIKVTFPSIAENKRFVLTRPILIDDYDVVILEKGTHVRNISINSVGTSDYTDTAVFKDNLTEIERFKTSDYNSLSSPRISLTSGYLACSRKVYCNTSNFAAGDFVQVESNTFGGGFGIADRQLIDMVDEVKPTYITLKHGANVSIPTGTVRNLTASGKRFILSPKILGGGKVSSSYYVGDGLFGVICNVECYEGEFDLYQEAGIGWSANNVHHSRVTVSGFAEYTGLEFAFLSTGSRGFGNIECREGFVTNAFGFTGNKSSIGFMSAEGATDCSFIGSISGRFYASSFAKFQSNSFTANIIATGFDYAACIIDVNHEGYNLTVDAVSKEPNSNGVLISQGGSGVISKVNADVSNLPVSLFKTTNLDILSGSLISRASKQKVNFIVNTIGQGIDDYNVKISNSVLTSSLGSYVKSSLDLVTVGSTYLNLNTINLQPYGLTNDDGVISVEIIAATTQSATTNLKLSIGSAVYESPAFSSADGLVRLSLQLSISAGGGYNGLGSGVATFIRGSSVLTAGVDTAGQPIMNYTAGAAVTLEAKGDSETSKVRLDMFSVNADRMSIYYVQG